MTNPTFEDMFNMICGEQINYGANRKVFHHKWDETLVVKVETDERMLRPFSNVIESWIWDHASDKVREWLAPVKSLSPDGRILFQMKCDPLPLDFKLPYNLPRMFNDVKKENFGLYKGKLVCVDYEIINIELSLKPRRKHG